MKKVVSCGNFFKQVDEADRVLREQIAKLKEEEFDQVLEVSSDSTKDSDGGDCFSNPVSTENIGALLNSFEAAAARSKSDLYSWYEVFVDYLGNYHMKELTEGFEVTMPDGSSILLVVGEETDSILNAMVMYGVDAVEAILLAVSKV